MTISIKRYDEPQTHTLQLESPTKHWTYSIGSRVLFIDYVESTYSLAV